MEENMLEDSFIGWKKKKCIKRKKQQNHLQFHLISSVHRFGEKWASDGERKNNSRDSSRAELILQ
jgi:hypothetical protein